MEKERILELKKEAESNPAVMDVFKMFSGRERARGQVSLKALALRMKQNGYEYNEKDYDEILRLLAKYEFGDLEEDKKGRVKRLKNVKYTLQSIGKVVCSQNGKLEKYDKKAEYKDLSKGNWTIESVKPDVSIYPFRVSGIMSITMSVNGKAIIVPLPEDLTADEIHEIVKRFQGKNINLK